MLSHNVPFYMLLHEGQQDACTSVMDRTKPCPFPETFYFLVNLVGIVSDTGAANPGLRNLDRADGMGELEQKVV